MNPTSELIIFQNRDPVFCPFVRIAIVEQPPWDALLWGSFAEAVIELES